MSTLAAAGVLLALTACSKPEGSGAPDAPSRDDASIRVARDDSGANGWVARLTGSGGRAATDHSPTGAFALAGDESVHPAIPAVGFGVTFEAVVSIDVAGVYRFGAEIEGGSGEVAVTLPSGVTRATELRASDDGPVMSGPLNLSRGLVAVSYRFDREGNAPARLRPLWSMERSGLDGFKTEPIPSDAVGVLATSGQAAATASLVRDGRVLLGELGCVSCHDADEKFTQGRTAPDLADVAQRADAGWMTKWITSPQLLKPGCGMPDVVGDEPADIDDTRAVVAFLASLSEPVEWPSPATEESVFEAGRELYQGVGCMACHGEADSRLNTDWTPKQPFGELGNKWNVAALSEYLRDPHEAHPSGQMPSLLLTEEESDAIATYLVRTWGPGEGTPFETSDELVAQGRAAFVAQGCVNCHALQGVEAGPAVKSLADLTVSGGCLDETDTATPRYALSSDEIDALSAAIGAAKDWGDLHDAPIDHALMTVEAHRCTSCHVWHGDGGPDVAIQDRFESVEETDLGNEARFPPRLSGVGWKLTSQWLEQVLAEGARARPYMKTRMPVFASDHVGDLTPQLAALDGVWPSSDTRPVEVNDELVQAGLQLVGSDGFNCISCHDFADAPPAGRPGPNMAAFGERIRYDWWSRYVHNPARFKPGTLMSRFFMTETSTQPVLGADIDRQVDAMWAYFSLGELFMPAPEGIQTPGALAVRVLDEPTIFRTFLKGVGSRGIAVGFPAGVHFAYDANTSRLAYAWTGSFLDASGAWAGRGGNTVAGQGPTVWTAPIGPAVAVGAMPAAWDSAEQWAFEGYSLDDAGVPTLHSRSGDVRCAETPRPYPREGALFSRTFELTGLNQGDRAWIRVGDGAVVASAEGGSAELSEGVVQIDAQSDSVTIVIEVQQ